MSVAARRSIVVDTTANDLLVPWRCGSGSAGSLALWLCGLWIGWLRGAVALVVIDRHDCRGHG
jgi:hypothetical protein